MKKFARGIESETVRADNWRQGIPMKNRVEVVIAGNRFTMTGEQDEEYMTKIAALVDNRVCKIKESGASLRYCR